MVFDGRDYRSAGFIYPNVYHPHAPLVGPALSAALKAAYFTARRSARTILRQGMAMNFRDPVTSLSSGIFAQGSYVRIAEGFRYIPDAVTHLAGEALFAIFSSNDLTVRVSHRLVAVGAGTDTGAAAELEVTSAEILNYPMATADGDFGFQRFISANFELELADAPAGNLTEVYVEAFAEEVNTSNPASYLVGGVQVWTEIRD